MWDGTDSFTHSLTHLLTYLLIYSLTHSHTYLLTHSLTQVGVGSERSPDVRGRARCSSQAHDRQSLFPQDITVFCMYLSSQFCFSLIFRVFIIITTKIILYIMDLFLSLVMAASTPWDKPVAFSSELFDSSFNSYLILRYLTSTY